jgi:hypothetical protein
MNKTFSRLFLKNAWKPLNFIQIIAPEKVCPSVEQNEIDIYCVLIKDGKYTWKWTCSTHGLYVFWKENHPNLCVFSMKLTFLQFYVNFITSSYSTKQFLDQTECILCLLIYISYSMPWLGYPNDLTDFWRPDDGRNRTCFFAASVL